MTISRRSFLAAGLAGLVGPDVARASRTLSTEPRAVEPAPRSPDGAPRVRVRDRASGPGFDPWLEVRTDALRHNASQIARLVGGRPILAVVKNNAYGLGLQVVGPVLDAADEVAGLAVVKAEEALALRQAGVRKPVLLMGLFSHEEGRELVARDVRLAPYTDDAPERLARLAAGAGRPVPVHLYLDTGMGRLGMPVHRALPWVLQLAARPDLRIEGTFMTFTETDDFDPTQLERLLALVSAARRQGANLGAVHAASSHGLFFRRDAHLDMVRPGLTLYGSYPSGAKDLGLGDLRPAFRLRARVVRVERLRAGDGVSYGRNYVAERPTWVATLPVGHADGYPRSAVRGAEVLIGPNLYRVIGAVTASHTIVEVGEEKTVEIGDEATFIGPDHEAVHPNTLAARAGISVYDVLMHLSARLPRSVI